MRRTNHGIYLPQYQWDDIQGSVATARLPSSNAPTWTTYDFGAGGVAYAVQKWDVGDYADIWVQTSHSMKLKSDLELHLHWSCNTNAAGETFKFQADVMHASIKEAWTTSPESPLTVEVTLDGDEADKHNVKSVGTVTGHNETVSTIYAMRLTRIASSGVEYGDHPAEDLYVFSLDNHFLKDSVGSSRKRTK
jgi:hypothetical protein